MEERPGHWTIKDGQLLEGGEKDGPRPGTSVKEQFSVAYTPKQLQMINSSQTTILEHKHQLLEWRITTAT